MKVTEENCEYYLQTMRVDFLTERWEREWYTLALMRAAAWGKKVDKENKEYFKKNHLIDKYNV
jgi:hypothetical protein